MIDANILAELRIYHLAPGREGDMQRRLEGDLTRLFPRHGIIPVGTWNAVAGPDLPALVYLMLWPDMAVRDRCWAGFYADPDWAEARARTNAGGELVERFENIYAQLLGGWSATPDLEAATDGGVHEMVLQAVAAGRVSAASKYISDTRDPNLQTRRCYT